MNISHYGISSIGNPRQGHGSSARVRDIKGSSPPESFTDNSGKVWRKTGYRSISRSGGLNHQYIEQSSRDFGRY